MVRDLIYLHLLTTDAALLRSISVLSTQKKVTAFERDELLIYVQPRKFRDTILGSYARISVSRPITGFAKYETHYTSKI